MVESGTPVGGGGGLDEQRAVRLAKLEALKAEGTVPYADRFARTHDLVGVRQAAEATDGTPAADAPLVRTAGRVMTVRPFGRLVFLHLQDGSGRCQVALDEKDVGAEVIERFSRFVDLGDHIGVEGRVGRTKKGEPTLFATSWTFLSKALRPLPEKWKGLGDLEARQRERYLDLVSNPDTRARFRLRTRFVREMRRYLDDHGFEEVDTPVLQTKASGALARPFHSHHNALDLPVVLRIAPETWLKQCVAGGLDRVYEIARCFRNEGMDPSHLQDFTLVEWYAAYWDFRDNMAFTESLVLHLLDEVVGSRVIEHGGRTIDFTPLFRHSVGFDRMQRMLDSAMRLDEGAGAYPPYNIESRGEDAYRITMAVAGFGEGDLDITVKENSLVVTGNTQKDDEGSTFLYRGIAGRAFERRFQLADHIKVVGASLVNGLLQISRVGSHGEPTVCCW